MVDPNVGKFFALFCERCCAAPTVWHRSALPVGQLDKKRVLFFCFFGQAASLAPSYHPCLLSASCFQQAPSCCSSTALVSKPTRLLTCVAGPCFSLESFKCVALKAPSQKQKQRSVVLMPCLGLCNRTIRTCISIEELILYPHAVSLEERFESNETPAP